MSEIKACPYCGEQILSIAIKCKHCGSDIGSSSNSIKNQFKMRPAFVVSLAIILLIIIGTSFLYNWSRTGTLSGRGYTDADVASVEQSIRVEFSKRHATKVEEVHMILESPTKMTGYAKVRVPLLGIMNKSCTATLGENGQSIWECK